MATNEMIARLEGRASKAEEMIAVLDKQIRELKSASSPQSSSGDAHTASEIKRLKEENERLKAEVAVWKTRLIEAECRNGVKQYAVPDGEVKRVESRGAVEEKSNVLETPAKVVNSITPADKKEKPIKNKEKEKKQVDKPAKPSEEPPVDISRLDLRIGRIVSASKHPDADSLYVEEVDIGEEKCRTVVSGLVKFVPLEEMQDRMVMLLCNLKPAKMRGVLSQAMVMCASTPEKVEILTPPAGSAPGDRVVCEEFPGEPDKELNPKKKVFEQVASDLKTDDNLRASYKGKALVVPNKGNVTAKTLANVQIK